MILTLYYMAATCMQWYRLERMRNKLCQYLAICNVPTHETFFKEAPSCSKTSTDIVSTAPPITKGIVLYRGTYDSAFTDNQKLGDLLCYEGDSKCCTVVPEKRIDLSVWIGFTKGYSTFPFEIIEDDFPNADSIKNINILLHASLEPSSNIDEIHSIRIEHFGIPIAWKVDSIMALIIRTDMQLFTSLSAAFMSKTIAINNHLQLLRIETVSLSGKVYECRPKDVTLGMEWIQKLIPKQWNTHVMQLKNLCSHVKYKQRDDLLRHHKKLLPHKRTDKHTDRNKSSKKDSSKTSNIPSTATHTSKEIETEIFHNVVPLTSTGSIISSEMNSFETTAPTVKTSDETVESDTKILNNTQTQSSVEYDEKPTKLTKQKSSDLIITESRNPSTNNTNLSLFRKCQNKVSEKLPEKSSKKTSVAGALKKRFKEKKSEAVEDVKDKVNVIENPLENLSIQASESKSTPMINSTNSDYPILNGNGVSKSESDIPGDQTKTFQSDIPKHSEPIKNCSSKSIDSSSVKPPNVLIYAESAVERESVTKLMTTVLHKEKYSVYSLSPSNVWWGSKATLLVVCGAVANRLGSQMLDYLLSGGRILCLCSDFINTVLPTFTTAEVRERELVRFSYDRWHRVRMIHHIFCYQPSPGRKLFSKDSSEEVSPNSNRCPTPSIIEVKNSSNESHKLEVKVLGAEDTWHTPSLILATDPKSGGIAVFSQVHLELEPSQYESDEKIYPALTESDVARLDIIRHILEKHLGLDCPTIEDTSPIYKPAYFLGSHELKLAMLSRLASGITDNIYKTANLKLQFCGKGVEPNVASSTFLPILVHSCPETFSTLKYFENLETSKIGRLVLYCEIIDSTMNVFSGVKLEHGMAVVARRQVNGQGRSGNNWLSPDGCAMFSLQLHIPMQSILGQRAPLVQILSSVVIVNALKSIPGYESLDLNLKWPNDIFANKSIKIGGVIVTSVANTSTIVCNIGIGVNLNNAYPTISINQLIRSYNEKNGGKLPELDLEVFLAHIFNEFERLYDLSMTPSGIAHLYELYYSYWLHENAEVTVLSESGQSRAAKVIGIDNYGYIEVSSNGEIFSVHPDGNSFDMLVGLIAPKLK